VFVPRGAFKAENDNALCNMKVILLPDLAHIGTADGSAGMPEGMD
jgi:hypothetical protein